MPTVAQGKEPPRQIQVILCVWAKNDLQQPETLYLSLYLWDSLLPIFALAISSSSVAPDYLVVPSLLRIPLKGILRVPYTQEQRQRIPPSPTVLGNRPWLVCAGTRSAHRRGYFVKFVSFVTPWGVGIPIPTGGQKILVPRPDGTSMAGPGTHLPLGLPCEAP